MNSQLREAIKVFRAGKKSKARRLVVADVKKNPHNPHAWFLLSYLVDKREQQVKCLQLALNHSPHHQHAKKRLARLESVVKTDMLHKEKHVQTKKSFSKTALVETKTNHRILATGDSPTSLSKEDFVWSLQSDAREDFESVPSVIGLLFEDVARLPIITSPHQELWLGIQLKAGQRWLSNTNNNSQKSADESNFLTICKTLISNHLKLKDLCLENDIQSPKLEIWISELLSARQDVYKLKQSRLRRFIRRAQKLLDKRVYKEIMELTASIAEVLCWFPEKALVQMAGFIQEHNHLPPASDIAIWLTTKTLTEQIQTRTKQAEQTLVVGYLRYALRVARGYVGQGIDYADLVQEGFWGLMRAAKKFDYRVQARFGTYATSWIWQAIGRAIADQGKTIRIPVHMHEQLRKYDQACTLFDSGSRKRVTNPEILYRADILKEEDFKRIRQDGDMEQNTPRAVQERYEKAIQKAELLEFVRRPSVPFDSLCSKFNTQTSENDISEINAILETFPDTNANLPELSVDKLTNRSTIEQKILANLKPRQKQVLSLRYGFEDGQERTLEEVGRLFGLTRERIRQIEAKALTQLNGMLTHGLLPDLHDLFPDQVPPPPVINIRFSDFPGALDSTIDNDEDNDYVWLDLLLDNLPRSNWVKGKHATRGIGTREEQVLDAFYSLSAPAHFSDIAEQVNAEITGQSLDEQYVYGILAQHENTFILLGQGVFSLVEWEKQRINQENQMLPFCPITLPDPPDYENAFFESVLVGRGKLSHKISTKQFIYQMLQWAQADPDQQKWFLQSILSAYYLVGLIPYVFYFGDDDPIITCTLPDLSIQELRYHCLQTLTERLVAMPEFWWLFQKEQPVRPSTLGEEFADIHPNGLDDTLHRLYLLASLGAAQKLKYGRYRLTPLGVKCAHMWQKQPDLEIEPISETGFEDHLTDFAIW